MLQFIYNSYFFEIFHNYYLRAKNIVWFHQNQITYTPLNSHSKDTIPTTLSLSKLETIPEEIELTDFYYLSLFRESETTWSIHGLWPQTNAHTYPTYCHKVTFDPSLLAPILEKLEQYWYSQGHTLPLDEKFWQHEYEKHGSCVYTPMNELEYFQNTIQLYEKALELGLPNTYYNPKTKKCLIPVNQKLEFIPPSH